MPSDLPAPAPAPSNRPPRRLYMPRTVRRLMMVLLLAAVIEYLVVPQLAGARQSIHLVSHANFWLAIVALVLEAASLLAYSQLTHSLLPRRVIPLQRVFRINLSTLSVSHVVPGGTAAGASLGYRLLTASGVAGPEAGFALALQGIGSAVVLNSVLWVALIVSLPLYGFNPLYGTAAVIGVLLIAFVAVMTILMTRGEDKAVAILRSLARRMPFLHEDSVEAVFRRLSDRLEELATDSDRLWASVGWAAANWLLDAASLWVFLLAFGKVVNPDALLVAYGLANVLAAIPVTPGGLGVVEGVLTPALVGFGVPKGVAILGVLSWRLVNFWLPIPAGAGAYLSLRLGGDRNLLRPERLEELRGGAQPPRPARP